MRSCVALIALGYVGCGGMPLQPTLAPSLPLAVTGQSQVGIFLPALQRDYPGPIVSAWQSGVSIAYWGPADLMWTQLAPLLHQPLRAVIVSQGESDCDGLSTAVTDYAQRFPETMIRIRREASDLGLLILVATVTPVPTCEHVRAIQAAWVASDARAILVNTDDLPRVDMPRDVHLTPIGGAMLAARILAALPPS